MNNSSFAPLSYVSPEEYAERRRDNIRIYSYCNRIITPMSSYFEKNPSIAIGFFDQDSSLLKLYGSDQFLTVLSVDDIDRGTRFDMNSCGKNAVNYCLKKRKPCDSSEVPSEHPVLEKYFFYCAPVTVQKTYAPYTDLNTVCVGVIVPRAQQNPTLEMIPLLIADDLQFELHAQQISYDCFIPEEYARLDLNLNSYTGKGMIYYHSDNLFELLGTQAQDIMYRPLDSLLAPSPKNQELWDIISEMRVVTEYPISISVGTKRVDCIITTRPYWQKKAHVKGIFLTFTTQKRQVQKLSGKISNKPVKGFESIIGQCSLIQSAKKRAALIANTSGNVLILGESGVGKDVFAQAIHNSSSRKGKPFIVVNCGAIPRDLIESELFGYESGAFTGANKGGSVGKFELADGGTIFLDEIGELPLDLQATLLRIVEQKQFMRIGGKKNVDIDVKIISATNCDLKSLINQKNSGRISTTA